jgi:two-component system response regulator NreC
MLTLILIDDHKLFREGLRELFRRAGDLEVLGEAGDAHTGLRLVEEKQPAVVLLDVSLPGVSGINAAREIRRVARRSKILVLSMHDRHDVVADAIGSGADGYALKDQPAAEIVAAVRAVARGERYLAPSLPPALLEATERTGKDHHPLAPLSPREREIFDLAVRGFSTDGMAKELFLSPKTVETHRARINRKLAVHSPAELLRFALKHGLIRQ